MLAAAGGVATAADGVQLFIDNCGACHRPGGEGTPNLAPPIVSPVIRASVKAGSADYAAKVVLNGLSGPISVGGVPFISAMPGRPDLTDAEIAAIVAHLLRDLNGVAVDPASLPGPDHVAALRQTPLDHAELRRLRDRFRAFE